MSRRRVRSQLNAINEINMTPLMDLVFLLLIVFMISMPLLQYNVDVEPPEFDANTIQEEDLKHLRNLGLCKDGSLKYENQTISLEDLLMELQMWRDADPNGILMFSADGSRPYDEVITLLAQIHRSGFKKVKLVTNAESK